MVFRITSCLVLFFLLPTLLSGQVVNFKRIYFAPDIEYARSIVQDYDSGFVYTGASSSFGNGTTDMILGKVDKAGNPVWTRTFGGLGVDVGKCLVRISSDSGFAIVGYSNSGGNGGYDVWVVRTDKIGMVLWDRYYGGTDWDFGHYIDTISGGGFIVSGSTYSSGAGSMDAYILQLDPSGNLLWSKTYGGINDEELLEGHQNSDGSFIFCGSTNSFGSGGNDLMVLKTNATGDTTAASGWMKYFGGSAEDVGATVIQTFEGGFLAAGTTESFGNGGKDGYLLKLDFQGNGEWVSFSGSVNTETLHSIVQTPDSNFAYVGATDNGGAGALDVHFELIHRYGWYLSGTTYGGTGMDDGYCIRNAFRKGFIMAGFSRSFCSGTDNIFLIRTDSSGIFSPNPTCIPFTSPLTTAASEIKNYTLKVFPNPSAGAITLRMLGPEIEGRGEVAVFDLTGREVYRFSIPDSRAWTSISTGLNINFDNLSPGSYNILISFDSGKKFSAPLIIAPY